MPSLDEILIDTKDGYSDAQAHYANAAIEPIAVIRAFLTPEEMKGFLKGNILKYRLRAGMKGSALQDIGKAEQYEKWLKEGEQVK